MNLSKCTYLINRTFETIIDYCWLFINYISAKLWGIKIGRNCKFKGKTEFKVYPGGEVSIGDNCKFYSSRRSNMIGVYTNCKIAALNSHARIEVGKDCGFSGTVIASALYIKIGNSVRCGANTLITDTDWHTEDSRSGCDKEIIIEDNVWLGYGVKVLKGVHIGENSVIGLGSIVTHDIPANVIAAGNPCTIIKKLNND